MNKYENLLDEAAQHGVTITDKIDLSETRFKGLYCNGFIAINQTISTETEKAGILAEELGHHHTTYGNILDLDNIENQKQELKARLWAYDKMIGLYGIISAYKHGCTSRHEVAEFLEVTEEFLSEALERYRSKYSPYVTIDNFIIYFEPALAVLEMI